jgi:hypothetical protein
VGKWAGSEPCQCWKKVSLGFKRQQRPSGALCVTTRKYWHGQKNRPNDSYCADLQAVLGAWSGLAAIKSTWDLPSAVGELGWRWSSGAGSR